MLSMQRGARSKSSAAWPSKMPRCRRSSRIEFRIGIHVGDIIFDENDIFGDGVNIAARLEGIAEPGGVCISDDTQRQIRGKVDIALEDIGPQNLKNIVEPMRAWRSRVDAESICVTVAEGINRDRTTSLAFPTNLRSLCCRSRT